MTEKEKPMRYTIAILCVLFFAAGLLASCAPSRVETDRGTSFKLQKFNQIANPDAGKDTKPVEGMDGQAAASAATKRQKEFEKQEKAPSYIFNLGNTGK
jgi:hypothetical protein